MLGVGVGAIFVGDWIVGLRTASGNLPVRPNCGAGDMLEGGDAIQRNLDLRALRDGTV